MAYLFILVLGGNSGFPVHERWSWCVPVSNGRVNVFPLINSVVRSPVQADGVLVHPGAVDLVVDVLDQAVHLPPRLKSDQLSIASGKMANQAPLLPVAEARVSWVVDFIFVAYSRVAAICSWSVHSCGTASRFCAYIYSTTLCCGG